MLQPFGEDIWLAEGPTTAMVGFLYPTRSVIIKLSDGTLFVWSPVRLTDDLRAELDALVFRRIDFDGLIQSENGQFLWWDEQLDAASDAGLFVDQAQMVK